jgi:3-oxoacyl-[acyl-carrier-protein] synthase-1
VNAGISGYAASYYPGRQGDPITMALVPDELFDAVTAKIDEGERFNRQHDRIAKMAIISADEAFSRSKARGAFPMLLALTDSRRDLTGLPSLTQTLADNCQPYIDPATCQSFARGRTAGIEAIDYAFSYLQEWRSEFLCVGGADSYYDDSSLSALDDQRRLLSASNPDGFAPGEGACFLLLTSNPSHALERGGCVIALHRPGIADEPGHLENGEAYRGEGLDRAFKLALANHPQPTIDCIYSSMNGESYWAREIGVAQLRNKQSFAENNTVQHPADCYGDLGAATAPALIALASHYLWENRSARKALVYASSDSAKRGAVVLEKQTLRTGGAG